MGRLGGRLRVSWSRLIFPICRGNLVVSSWSLVVKLYHVGGGDEKVMEDLLLFSSSGSSGFPFVSIPPFFPKILPPRCIPAYCLEAQGSERFLID